MIDPQVTDRYVLTEKQREQLADLIAWGRESNSPTWHIEREASKIMNVSRETEPTR